jgi:prepilin-type N-terminal cleavage/methylation domain-containing protein
MKNGFTLIEIIVVIGIMTAMGSISWVGLNSYQPSLALSSVSRDLTTDLRLAQQLTITEQINHGIFFDTLTNEYRLEKFGAETIILYTKQLPSGVTFCGVTGLPDNQAIFNPYGSVAYPGSVCLTNTRGQSRIIDIKPSGFIKIQN